MKVSTVNKKTLNSSFYVLGILFIFVVWYFGHLHFKNNFIVPSVNDTFVALKELTIQKNTYFVLAHTLTRLFIAIGLSFILGILLASLSKISYHFKAFVKPLFTLLKTLPIAVVIILLLVMLKVNSLYYIVGVVVLPIIYEATISGLDSVDKNIIEEVKLDSNISPYVVGKIYIPLTLPFIFTSLLQSFGLGIKVLVMAEFISNAPNSIGYEIMLYKDYANDMSYVYAWSIILVIFVICVDSTINLIKKRSLV